MKRIAALDRFVSGVFSRMFGKGYLLASLFLAGCAVTCLAFGESFARQSVKPVPEVVDEVHILIFFGIATFFPWAVAVNIDMNSEDEWPVLLGFLRFVFALGFVPWYAYLVWQASVALSTVHTQGWLWFAAAPFCQLAAMYALAGRIHIRDGCCAS